MENGKWKMANGGAEIDASSAAFHIFHFPFSIFHPSGSASDMTRTTDNLPTLSLNAARHVLLVEDEPRLREMLVRAVTDMGFEAHGVGSGEAALRAIEEKPFEVVVLDLNLPGMDGMELFEALRRRGASGG